MPLDSMVQIMPAGGDQLSQGRYEAEHSMCVDGEFAGLAVSSPSIIAPGCAAIMLGLLTNNINQLDMAISQAASALLYSLA
jgi:hypothetical protein